MNMGIPPISFTEKLGARQVVAAGALLVPINRMLSIICQTWLIQSDCFKLNFLLNTSEYSFSLLLAMVLLLPVMPMAVIS